MREIKFRAWDKNQNVMMNQQELLAGDGLYLIFSHKREMSGLIPMQYTGIKDQNGKEIYEGDVVQAKGMRGGVSGVVEYDSDRAKFVLNISDVAGSVDKFDDSDLDWESYKILGNIHENPELLRSNVKKATSK